VKSIWREGRELPRFPTLEGNHAADVLVIGGGMAGLLCALLLRRAGVDCLLVEGRRVCGGVTGNTTAKLTIQHGLIYHKIWSSQGERRAADYLRANRKAMEMFETLCQGLDCSFERQDSIVYTRREPEVLRREQAALRQLGVETRWVDVPEIPVRTAGGLCVPDQAMFDPLAFVEGIMPGLDVREGTVVRRVKGCVAETDFGTVRANKIVFCTHFPFVNRKGNYFMKMYQHRSYVLALEGAKLPGGMYVDEDRAGLSFRRAGDLLLLGGGGHRTGTPGGGWEHLRRLAAQWYPDSREVARWAAQDCVTLDGAPYIGRYSPSQPDWYVATGFDKWGMTSSMAAAMAVRDWILGREVSWSGVFDPARPMKLGALAGNLLTSAGHLLTPRLRRCPHMGCALTWNREEHSWDCPCHGSRFEEDGRWLDNPTTRDFNGAPEE